MQGPCLTGLYEKYLWFPFFVKGNVSRPSDHCRDEGVLFLILSSENLKNSIYYSKFGMSRQRRKDHKDEADEGRKRDSGGSVENINEFKWLKARWKSRMNKGEDEGEKSAGLKIEQSGGKM